MERRFCIFVPEAACHTIYTYLDEPCWRVHEDARVHITFHPTKKNDVLTEAYFHSSNHQGEVALCQILEKQNRIKHLESIEVKKVKEADVQCSNCSTAGLNRLTCPEPCKLCGVTPYCTIG